MNPLVDTSQFIESTNVYYSIKYFQSLLFLLDKVSSCSGSQAS